MAVIPNPAPLGSDFYYITAMYLEGQFIKGKLLQNFYQLKRDNNPLRDEAFTFSCLGKLYPASNSDFMQCSGDLSKLLYETVADNCAKDEILIIGLTESGIIPSLLMHFEAIKQNLNTHIIYSTRRKLQGITFKEIHSHGPDHILPIPDCKIKEIWIVEDEITTGNTILNLIVQLCCRLEVNHVRCFAFMDFRNQQQKSNFLSITDKKNINCTFLSMHLPLENMPTPINSGQPLILHDSHENFKRPENCKLSVKAKKTKTEQFLQEKQLLQEWHLPEKRPALSVQSSSLFNPELWSLAFKYKTGTILAVGESVDLAACFAMANKNLFFQQISLSPWKIDGKSILSRMDFLGKYYLYNYENLKEPVFIICDPIDKKIETEIIKKLKVNNIKVKPFF